MDYHESNICFSENTSAAWLCAKSPEGRSSLITMMRKQGRVVVKDSVTRQESILKAKGTQLKEKQELFTKIADRKHICNENVITELTLLPPDGGPGTKATRKARNRRGRRDAIEHKLYCFPDCKRGRAQSETMVQCHACQTWAHYACIGEGGDDIVGIWTCNACRKMPTMVMELIGMVAKLQESVYEMRDTQLVSMLSDQQSKLHRLREDFNERLPVDTANTHAETTIDSPPKPTTLLVGNSLLTDVANVIIVGGTREVHNETTTLDEINDGFSRMIDTAKTAANTVFVCSVLPTSANKNDERRERANKMIRAT